MRTPSIHITLEDFHEILDELKSIDKSNYKIFLQKAKKVSATQRNLIANNTKSKQAVVKINSSKIGDAQLLADIIYASRVKMRHIGVRKITIGDSQWIKVKELVPVINEFCTTSNTPQREGYIQYVSMGLQLMKKIKKVNFQYAPSWLLNKSDEILANIRSIEELNKDSNPKGTEELHKIYVGLVAQACGIYTEYKDPSDYAHFIKAREFADTKKVDYSHYVNAQFYALEFCNGIPRIEDLYGTKAEKRLLAYLMKFKINIDVESKTNIQVDWNQFK